MAAADRGMAARKAGVQLIVMGGIHIAVVGGGAAGMMAAATIAEQRPGARVTLYERNPRLGAKVIISGGGRCNVTTGVVDVREVLSRYPRGARWLRHAMHSFPPRRVMEWFEARGVPLKTETDLRVFPVSDDGHDIVGVFARIFRERGVDVRLRCGVTAILPASAARENTFADAPNGPDSAPLRPRAPHAPAGYRITAACAADDIFDAVILTTGGSAFRHTGSTGDGYRFAAALGHTVTPLHPSLNAWVVHEPWAHELAGVSFPDAALRVGAAGVGGRDHAVRGPFLFTHVGVTGPAVFALSSLAAADAFDRDHPLTLRINLLPDLDQPGIDATLQERFARLGGRAVVNVLDTLLPRSICTTLCALAEIDPAARAAGVGRGARRRLAGLVSALPLTVVGRRNGDEFVTAGGVATGEVDPRTMQSRVRADLFFAGEILDVDGFTGGFNLQAAWATGRLAGLAAGASLQSSGAPAPLLRGRRTRSE